ncbi:T9SS type A sorting domain-containing protein [Hymenobacter convexus]|uniref:T9SS type A sorting domain-containing protein n=1 Tax=Hymenobacter sp. CA1UV-4 TaxID=3063782 RepID=UPI0027139CA6|nr:T9SS type A sorting domain-containing protein [Hymenobacter sp. CA1UV-4]MDO7854167.1 T9SS type A sorting domain-containing protein [Hymenobacter sp. CA1UV-4]
MMQRYFLPLLLCACLSLGSLLGSLPDASAAVMHRPGQQGSKPGADEKTLVVYPNPSTGIVHLTINNLQGKKVELSVLNVIGSVMYRETLTELNDRYTKMLDLSKFTNGLYYVRLESDNTSQMCKLVIR